ncbi:MAG: hypothetical protein WDM90_14355 [Ferruginibacter sp.]
MNYDKKNAAELKEKIQLGLELTRKRLLEAKRKADGEFVFSQNGKIVRVKARDIKD